MSTHDELKANAAGYVLGSLGATERREFELHLAEGAECAAEVASLRPAVDVLATMVPQVTPRAEVRDRILRGAVLGSGGTGLQTGSRPDAGPGLRPRAAAPIWLAGAAAIVFAVGAGVYAFRLQRQMTDLQARFDQERATSAVLAAPDLARIDLQGQSVAPDARA